MQKFVNEGDSIEGAKSCIHARGIYDKPAMVKIGDAQVTYLKYKTFIRAIITLTEELNPKINKISPTSNLTLNDTLEAPVIEIYVPKQIKKELVSNYSHVHGIQNAKINMFTYAKIIIPFHPFLQRAATKQLPTS